MISEAKADDVRFALRRLSTGWTHYPGCPKRSIQVDEFACECGLTRAREIAYRAAADADWVICG